MTVLFLQNSHEEQDALTEEREARWGLYREMAQARRHLQAWGRKNRAGSGFRSVWVSCLALSLCGSETWATDLVS